MRRVAAALSLALALPATAWSCVPTEAEMLRGFSWHIERYADLIGLRGLDIAFSTTFVPTAIRETLALTPQDELALVYAELDGATCLFAVDERGLLAAAPIASAAEVTGALGDLRDALGVTGRQAARAAVPLRAAPPPSVSGPAPDRQAALDALTAALIPPTVAGVLDGHDEVLVLPVRDIGTAPFALLAPGGRPMVSRGPVTLVPSIAELTWQESIPGLPVGTLAPQMWVPGWADPLVIGDPAAGDDPDWRFPPLPGALAEARAVNARVGGTLLTGTEATLAAVRGGLAGADLVYVAAHGIADADDPLNGGFLALADGRLTAGEVQHMRLGGAPLVVLSACQTGLGEAHAAGTIGLARAFVFAGASGVVMSLWNVDDRATAELMGRFAERVGRQRPARALQTAMAEMAALYPNDPALWSGFLLLSTLAVDGG